jgi:ABC-type cobalamin/Fe3+-siderophores transport system ATPase subunit
MDIDVTFKGYRCFSPESPATVSFRSDIAALVGVNNSGKSTLLKAFYELRPTFDSLLKSEMLQQAVMGGINLVLPAGSGDASGLFWHFGSGNSDIEIEIALPDGKASGSNWKLSIAIVRQGRRVSVLLHDLAGVPVPRTPGAWRFSDGADPQKNGVNFGTFNEMFSALRTLRNCVYYPSVRHVSPFTPDNLPDAKYYDAFVGKTFVQQWALSQQGTSKESTEKMDAIVEDLRRIFRFKRLVVQADTNNRDLLVVADGRSSLLSELGTGFAQFVLLLGNLGLCSPSYVLIDEPETNLHPSLQLDFLNSIVARASEGIFFATHNLGLARQAADRIFALTPGDTTYTLSSFYQTPDLAKLIGELSFGRSDFSPARKLLLVEGQTDVLTFQNLLAVFGREHEFAIISLNGEAGINSGRLAELEHMCALGIDVRAVIDSERATPNAAIARNRAEFAATCGNLGISCQTLQRRAIENYFSQRAIDEALGPGRFRALGPFEDLGNVPNHWPKKKNWRIARATRKDEIEVTDLGKLLASL